jgi:predicted TIM-barrel fold metal-dependent hydrolase
MPSPTPFITLEEHFLTTAVSNYWSSLSDQTKIPENHPHITTLLTDLTTHRLPSMNASSIAIQILSHPANPVPIPLEICTAANDELATTIFSSGHAHRFRAFALLPTADPEASAAELTRCINTHSTVFLGSLLDNTTNSQFYDTPAYHPLFAAHVSLNVPLYLHPSPQESASHLFTSESLSPKASTFLSNHGYGWHATCALHFLRLYLSGLFDKFPTLKMILGHMGEMLPFQLDRISRLINLLPAEDRPKRGIKEVWRENVWVTTSGMFSLAPMACLLRTTGAARCMFSVDYPFGKDGDGVEFMEELKGSGLVEEEEWEGIAYRNAERLLGLKIEEGWREELKQ